MFETLRRYWVVLLIVGITLIAGAVTSVAAANAKEPLSTILIGDTLLVSLAIFSAAITAAVYTKPAYDQATALLRPPKLVVSRLSLSDGLTELEREADGRRNAVFLLHETPRKLLLVLTVENEGKGAPECVFRLYAPVACKLRPRGTPEARHYLSPLVREVILAPEVVTSCRSSISRNVIPPRMSRTYAAEITIPDEEPPWPLGWPMRALVFGIGRDENAVDLVWWCSVTSPPTAEDSDVAQPIVPVV